MEEIKLIKKIGEKTGLKNEEQIKAYIHFSESTHWDHKRIIEEHVQEEFYLDLINRASTEIKDIERKFWDDLKNNKLDLKKEETSPLNSKAKELYEFYLDFFTKKGLIQKQRLFRFSPKKYPILLGYNYYNDLDIYYVEKGGRRLKV